MARPDDLQRFVLQGFDARTGTVCLERCVSIADLAALHDAIGSDEEADPRLRHDYDLAPDELETVCALCLPSIPPDAIFTRIARWSPLNDIPYLVHTNFELPLMLDGRKPLAVFGDAYPSAWFDDLLAPFEPFVRSGAIIRRIVDQPMPALKVRRPAWDGMRNVYFALPGEKWRIDAYIEMQDEARQSGWDDSFERRQGALLGYEDWQNDWWLEHRRRQTA